MNTVNFTPKPCPICGKAPKIFISLDFSQFGFGGYGVVQCKPFLRKPHLRIESGGPSAEWAEQSAIQNWNQEVNRILEKEKENG